MITLIRWFKIKSKKIKYELMIYEIIDKIFMEIIKHPEEIEQKMVDSVVKLIIGNKTK